MNNQPLVSVITPSYNCENTVAQTIKSVLEQTLTDWEMIIVDDMSSDNTCNIIKSFAEKDSRIKLVTREWNAGPAIARNVAIENARGRFIAFLDSDDKWHKDKLTKQIKFMIEKNVELSFTSYNRLDSKGNNIGVYQPITKVSYKDLLKSNRIGCLTAIYDTYKLGKVYMPNIPKRQDLGLWLKILRDVDYAWGIDDVLADYLAVQEHSVSSNKITAAKHQWRLYREVEKLSVKKSMYYFVNYVYFGIKKSY